MPEATFKEEHSLEKRIAEAGRIREKYADRIPVICEKAERSSLASIGSKRKFLVPADVTIGSFIFVVRKRMQLEAEEALFMFVKNVIPQTTALMSTIYDEHKDEDGFLYLTYSGENTFGAPEDWIEME